MACLSGRPQLHTNTSLLTMEVISQLTYRVPNFALHNSIILGPHLWVISVEEHRLSHSQPHIYTSRLTMEVLRYRSILIVYLLLPSRPFILSISIPTTGSGVTYKPHPYQVPQMIPL